MKRIGILSALVILAAFAIWFVADVKPVIELNGSSQVEIDYGELYEDEGSTGRLVEKHFGRDLFSIRPSILQNNVQNEVGTYQIVYKVGFLFKEASAERTVVVVDREPPVIELTEQTDTELTLPGEPFQECGYRATDNVDGDIADQVYGDLSGQVVVDNWIENEKPGLYEVIYAVEDRSGNKAVAKRTVTVVSLPRNHPEDNGDKVIYLTFDDGPGPHTERLLNILDEYDVKATFFVMNAHPEYRDMIGEVFRRGHTVAIHTYSHDYSDVYSNKEAYYNDLNKMQEIVVEQTGEPTTLFRLPGGSSNMVSKKYCKGIMSLLTKSLEEDGYHYFDWNVSSTDGGGTTETSVVFNNVINGCSGRRTSVVLQHDTKGFSVDAVAQIIEWGLRNGYTFKALDENSPTAHHGVNN